MKYIKPFNEVAIDDVPSVGGKNASLGQMIQKLKTKGIPVPDGFAVTAQAYWYYLEQNNLVEQLKTSMSNVTESSEVSVIQKAGKQVRHLIASATMPDDLAAEIVEAYHALSRTYDQELCDVAVRSSATAEDLPNASFAGQQETFLNVRGDDHLIEACKKSMASLFTDRAIVYRMAHGFDHFKVALSVGVQKMIRSDLACSGVAFSVDTETGFKEAIIINAAYGLGTSIVEGSVTPDEYVVHKQLTRDGFTPIIQKRLGDKKIKVIYTDNPDDPTAHVSVDAEKQVQFCLSDEQIMLLSQMMITIEDHYSEEKKRWMPMDVEWAIDGQDKQLYIIQARPETIHGNAQVTTLKTYQLKDGVTKKTIASGQAVGSSIAVGTARVIDNVARIADVQKGDIIVTDMTDPDWVPAMKKAAAIITQRGGRTCHAAIVSRELGISALVGVENALTIFKDGQTITVDCSVGNTGLVYEGDVPFDLHEVALDTIPTPPVDVMVNIADPDSAFVTSFLPVAGVGLARLEFIIANMIGVHPMALIQPDKITDADVQKTIAHRIAAYADGPTFFVDALATGVGMIAGAFFPRPVIVRLSDFKSNEYRNLIGGTFFEPEEENPMLGFRGASRYYHERYKDAFALECAALKKAREQMGLTNIKIMVPFVRTLDEARGVLDEMKQHNLVSGENGLEIIMMCEVPSNVLLVQELAQLFDGFSIGSNDLTQLTLGVDRDSQLLADTFDERDPAVKKMLAQAIAGARASNVPIGICGQAPSDYPEIATFLVEQGISSLSLNSDSVVPFVMRF